MNSFIRDAVYNGLCDSYDAAHDTGNIAAVASVLADAYECLSAGQISILQLQAIEATAEIDGYDL